MFGGEGLIYHQNDKESSCWALGSPVFIQAHLERKVEEQRTLLARIPFVGDLQSAWLILLHSAAARANHLLRVVEPQFCRCVCMST